MGATFGIPMPHLKQTLDKMDPPMKVASETFNATSTLDAELS